MNNIVLSMIFIKTIYCASGDLNIRIPKYTKYLPRFWTNTGFCPPAPINGNSTINFFLSDDVATNIEIISALPNNGLHTIRIHWLLNMIRIT